MVRYKEIKDHSGYRVGDDGSVWSRLNVGGTSAARPRIGNEWRRLKPVVSGVFYPQVRIGGRTRRIHRLVLEAFVGLRPKGLEACHNDGNPNNNTLSNLRWDTRQSNSDDIGRHGTRAVGERQGAAKLTDAEVNELLLTYAAGVTKQSELAARYGVSRALVCCIVKGTRRLYADRKQAAVDSGQKTT
jgi:hypothetical protein